MNMEEQPPPYPFNYQQQQQPPPKAVLGQPWGQPWGREPMMAPEVGKLPEVITCPNCRAEVRTRVERSLSQNGWIWSFVLWYGNCLAFKKT